MATDPKHGDEAELYRLHHGRLLRVVRRCVGGSHALIEDACSFAWLQLLAKQPERGPDLLGWLCTVAIHEGYRLSRLERRQDRLDVGAGRGDGALFRAELVEDLRACLSASKKRAPRSGAWGSCAHANVSCTPCRSPGSPIGRSRTSPVTACGRSIGSSPAPTNASGGATATSLEGRCCQCTQKRKGKGRGQPAL